MKGWHIKFWLILWNIVGVASAVFFILVAGSLINNVENSVAVRIAGGILVIVSVMFLRSVAMGYWHYQMKDTLCGWQSVCWLELVLQKKVHSFDVPSILRVWMRKNWEKDTYVWRKMFPEFAKEDRFTDFKASQSVRMDPDTGDSDIHESGGLWEPVWTKKDDGWFLKWKERR